MNILFTASPQAWGLTMIEGQRVFVNTSHTAKYLRDLFVWFGSTPHGSTAPYRYIMLHLLWGDKGVNRTSAPKHVVPYHVACEPRPHCTARHLRVRPQMLVWHDCTCPHIVRNGVRVQLAVAVSPGWQSYAHPMSSRNPRARIASCCRSATSQQCVVSRGQYVAADTCTHVRM